MTDQQPPGRTDQNISDYADVGKTLIGGIAPAEKGWILGFIVVVAILIGATAWIASKSLSAQETRSAAVQKYFEMVETNRAQDLDTMAAMFADQTRRSQEVIRALAESVARDAERAGQAALSTIDEAARRQYIQPNPADFIGPPEPPE